jgi:TPR repeat protein
MLVRGVLRAAAIAAIFSGAASANEGTSAVAEQKCAKQFKLEEHLILEWAALGGDPHAQYSIGQCAYPVGADALTRAEKVYALKWLTLAACDGGGAAGTDARDRMTRRLKYGSHISFRRFGGIAEDETWTAREKKLIDFRDGQIADLGRRLADVKSKSSAEEIEEARSGLADQFARMGPTGLLRLSEMTTCAEFGASESFAAAAWGAAADAWSRPETTSVYGASVRGDWDLAKEAASRAAPLARADKKRMEMEKDALLRADPARLARLEDAAALGRLQELGFADANEDGFKFSGRSTTTVVQHALEALGFIEFVNGPDNDYGPSTIEAVKKAQAAYGKPVTRWLAPEEVRQVVCDAAVKKSDPVSYYNLSMMYAEGLGFRKDVSLAKAAISRAEEAMVVRLHDAGALPQWKAREYPAYAERIKAAKAAISAAYEALPVHARAPASSGDELCR